jgi:hypothetical protein
MMIFLYCTDATVYVLCPMGDRTAVPNVRICHVVVTPVCTIFLEIEYKGMRFDQRRGDTSTSCIVRWRCTVTYDCKNKPIVMMLVCCDWGSLPPPRNKRAPGTMNFRKKKRKAGDAVKLDEIVSYRLVLHFATLNRFTIPFILPPAIPSLFHLAPYSPNI